MTRFSVGKHSCYFKQIGTYNNELGADTIVGKAGEAPSRALDVTGSTTPLSCHARAAAASAAIRSAGIRKGRSAVDLENTCCKGSGSHSHVCHNCLSTPTRPAMAILVSQGCCAKVPQTP